MPFIIIPFLHPLPFSRELRNRSAPAAGRSSGAQLAGLAQAREPSPEPAAATGSEPRCNALQEGRDACLVCLAALRLFVDKE